MQEYVLRFNGHLQCYRYTLRTHLTSVVTTNILDHLALKVAPAMVHPRGWAAATCCAADVDTTRDTCVTSSTAGVASDGAARSRVTRVTNGERFIPVDDRLEKRDLKRRQLKKL